jgi:hypothetical protein
MATFMTRVELHNADWIADYNKLHQEMALEGFKKTITSSKGITYDLPTAEYYLISSFSIGEVLEIAKRAAAKVGKQYSVITSETIGSTWHNLPETKK